MVNRLSKHRRGTTRACMEFLGLYGVYRLALSQSNFLRPGQYELVINKGDELPGFTVEKAGKYPCIKWDSLKFLDITILGSWIQSKVFPQSLWCYEEKGFFPYDYFTHADRLDETTLPPYETSYSAIKGCNYMLCIVSQIWLVSCFVVLIEIASKKVK